jgi:hypothetical protein
MNNPFTKPSGPAAPSKRQLIDVSLLLAVAGLFVWAILL